MKAIVEIEFKDLPVERIQQTLIEILHTLKALQMVDEGKVQIFTPEGVVTEKCVVNNNKVVA